ncbi:30S ribosome-binding factor RbfA [Sulfurovum sp. bin170]|uniref:30S ribosome-binding factor RbfA n=1 Tax=Sulfurovum sp. bin170 TaxID=2695268 RepID=UPI0013DE95BB|nr:30S ribosome-binding factor RbfA [Sulfurovum sp. bin170]NEW60142.1 30S ribosome-binding factor RbfA [Sulfurovum sp. bin170]
MKEEEIKRKRTESRLVELIPEALSGMNDNRINGLSVTEVVCSRGRYDAKVYLDKSYLNEKEQGEALKQLRAVSGYLSTYVRESEGWFKSPKFTFDFDDQLERVASIEALFKEIGKRKSKDADES